MAKRRKVIFEKPIWIDAFKFAQLAFESEKYSPILIARREDVFPIMNDDEVIDLKVRHSAGVPVLLRNLLNNIDLKDCLMPDSFDPGLEALLEIVDRDLRREIICMKEAHFIINYLGSALRFHQMFGNYKPLQVERKHVTHEINPFFRLHKLGFAGTKYTIRGKKKYIQFFCGRCKPSFEEEVK